MATLTKLRDRKPRLTPVLPANNALFAGGGIIGCMTVPWFLDRCGRRLALQITCLICVVSAVVQAASVHTRMLLVGRFINGIGVGMIDVAVPIYQSEISPAKVRGRMVGSHGFLVVVGYVSCYMPVLVEKDALTNVSPGYGWMGWLRLFLYSRSCPPMAPLPCLSNHCASSSPCRISLDARIPPMALQG